MDVVDVVDVVVGRTGAADVDAATDVDVVPNAVPASVVEDTKPHLLANTYLDGHDDAVVVVVGEEACKRPEEAGAGNDVSANANVGADVGAVDGSLHVRFLVQT